MLLLLVPLPIPPTAGHAAARLIRTVCLRRALQGFPGHKDAVTSLAFREGTHELFRCGGGAGDRLGRCVYLIRQCLLGVGAAPRCSVQPPS